MKTEVISAKQKNAVQKAVNALKAGKILVYPTETSYGIGCDGTSSNAVRKVHEIKKEPKTKPLIVLVPDLKAAKKNAFLTMEGIKLVKKPGLVPLTLVAKRRKSSRVLPGQKTIAFRVSSGLFAQRLSKKFCEAIVSTSANMHGKKPVFSGKKAAKLFFGKVDLIIDGGKLPKRKPSTIYDLQGKKILREGSITLAMIKKHGEGK